MCDDSKIFVFVYGTLKSGFPLDLGVAEAIVEDSINGTMYRHPYASFPLMKLDTGDEVHGEIHLYPKSVLEILDVVESEGSLYNRKEIITHGGRPAYVYESHERIDLSDSQRIADGVWR